MPYARAMSKFLVFALIGLSCVSAAASSSIVLSRYRAVTLGDSVEMVVDRLQVVASDVKLLYDSPSLVQELKWRPSRFVSGSLVTTDPLAEMVLTFHLGRLTRIVATYDRERTTGLTDSDLQELLSSVYGMALLRSTAVEVFPAPLGSTARKPISSWADADTLVVLWREEYPTRVGLTITSPATDRALQEAIGQGARLEAESAPQRERDRQAAAASALKARDAHIRLENKANFKP
jgi:hypothetical protein